MNHHLPTVDTGRPQFAASLQGPFYNANNIFMFYGGANRGEIAENVIQALRQNEPVLHVHGEAGSGKTMMSLVIADRIKRRFQTIRYDLPEISAARLLRHLLIELAPQHAELITAEQIRHGADWSVIELAMALVKKQLLLNQQASSNKPCVLIIDSSEALDGDCLQVIEYLSEVEADNEASMHCLVFHCAESYAEHYVSVGDSPQSAENHFWLRRLTFGEISEYLRHHMLLVDFNRRDLFTQEMAYFIAEESGGLFKSINTLARHAFSLAKHEEADELSMSHLQIAGLSMEKEQCSVSQTSPVRLQTAALAFLGFGVVVCSTAMLYLH